MKPLFKKNKLILTLSFIVIVLCAIHCKKEGRMDYIDANAPAPAQISDVKVTNLPGEARLTYKIPADPNFYYAKVVYEIQPNVYREAKSSLYTDTLKLDGFGDTLVHEVKIYSVGKNNKESEALVAQVKPLIPPVRSVFQTIKLISTFGGVQISFKNSSMANLAIVVMRDTTNANTWATLTTFHTGADSGRFSIRGLDSVSQKFAVFIRDRWDNKSDTLKKVLSPIYEQLIPKNTWDSLVLPTDQRALAGSNYKLGNLWNGSSTWASGAYASSNNSVLPQWFTLNLGKKIVMSRIVMHQAGQSGHLYNGSAPKTIEIWGSNNPSPDGSWGSWDSLATFRSFKPSGLPLGQQSDADLQYANIDGESFEFDHLIPAYRYIRWKTIETYASVGQVVFMEIDMYGQVQQ